MPSLESTRIAIIGLGYVGLPLAVEFGKRFPTVGYDIRAERVAALRRGEDSTLEVGADELAASPHLSYAHTLDDIRGCNVYIVTVPTPIDAAKRPDLTPLVKASQDIGSVLKPGDVVVYESTVYPGCTEEVCVPLLEKASGLVFNRDFFCGYSPERINPGDREHTIDKITKVVSGETPEVLDRVANLYNAITSGGVFRAKSIKAAEAAKVIENAQRDINIAFMNEIAQIFGAMDLSVWDVLEAARTKWNFLPFSPGLVGGHCIGVDPYYLSHRAEELGLDPQVILAGRGVNDGMAGWVAQRLHGLRGNKPGSALVLGLTFKEDVPDLRNSKVADLISALKGLGHDVTVHDPHADPDEAAHEYELTLQGGEPSGAYDLVLLAVPHREYLALGAGTLRSLVADGGSLADLKGALGGWADWTL